jgi:hypothetical protein
MSEPYAETLNGVTRLRLAPGARHECICAHLHRVVQASVANFAGLRQLPRRAEVPLAADHRVCPDLALVAVATGKLWLAAEIVNPADHTSDTVLKKQVYEEVSLPRLWMIDPRYDNVEVYCAGPYGLALKEILAGRDILDEKLLPEFQMAVADLFRSPPPV